MTGFCHSRKLQPQSSRASRRGSGFRLSSPSAKAKIGTQAPSVPSTCKGRGRKPLTLPGRAFPELPLSLPSIRSERMALAGVSPRHLARRSASSRIQTIRSHLPCATNSSSPRQRPLRSRCFLPVPRLKAWNYIGPPAAYDYDITDTDRNTDPIGRAAMGTGATATMPIWRTTEFGEAAAEHIIIGTVSAASTLAIDSPIPVGRAGA